MYNICISTSVHTIACSLPKTWFPFDTIRLTSFTNFTLHPTPLPSLLVTTALFSVSTYLVLFDLVCSFILYVFLYFIKMFIFYIVFCILYHCLYLYVNKIILFLSFYLIYFS